MIFLFVHDVTQSIPKDLEASSYDNKLHNFIEEDGVVDIDFTPELLTTASNLRLREGMGSLDISY